MSDIRKQLVHTLDELKIEKNIGKYYRGKVRDVYESYNRLTMVATDRLSAFDRHIVNIPYNYGFK